MTERLAVVLSGRTLIIRHADIPIILMRILRSRKMCASRSAMRHVLIFTTQ